MPLAWYSCAEMKVYHVCLDCCHRTKIEFEHLTFIAEDDIPEYLALDVCETCDDHELYLTDREEWRNIHIALGHDLQDWRHWTCTAIYSYEVEKVMFQSGS